jgi:lipid II:glycine glycyltransferase (peptidoglycan interpeptide bridge formation enzyme)
MKQQPEIKIVDDIDTIEWNKLLQLAPEATVFHTKEWLEVVSRSGKGRARYILGRNNNGELECGLPFIEHRRFGLVAAMSTIWGTPLLASGAPESSREAVLQEFAKLYKRFNLVYLSLSDYSQKCQHLKNLGFECRKDFLHRLELNRSYDELQKKIFNRSIRKNLNTAKKNGIVIVNIENLQQVRQYYDIARHTYLRRGGKMIYSLDFYENIFNIMLPAGLIKWQLAEIDGEAIAGAIHLVYKDTVFNLLEASYRDRQSLRPNDLLISAAIEWSINSGYKYYNFGASPAGAKELIRFKENWGARRMEFPVYEKKKLLFKMAGIIKIIK